MVLIKVSEDCILDDAHVRKSLKYCSRDDAEPPPAAFTTAGVLLSGVGVLPVVCRTLGSLLSKKCQK